MNVTYEIVLVHTSADVEKTKFTNFKEIQRRRKLFSETKEIMACLSIATKDTSYIKRKMIKMNEIYVIFAQSTKF